MIPELQTLYYYEIDHAHLDFDSDPVYQESMARVLAELGTQELSPALFSLLNTANQISFTHGFRLGASLIQWTCGGKRPFLTEVSPPVGGSGTAGGASPSPTDRNQSPHT